MDTCGYCGYNITKKPTGCVISLRKRIWRLEQTGSINIINVSIYLYMLTYLILLLYMYHVLYQFPSCWFWLVLILYELYLIKAGIIVHIYYFCCYSVYNVRIQIRGKITFRDYFMYEYCFHIKWLLIELLFCWYPLYFTANVKCNIPRFDRLYNDKQ